MELLLLLLPIALLGIFALDGSDDDDGAQTEPETDDRIQKGDSTDETFLGGAQDDLFFGAGGNDAMLGRAGFDILVGEGGNDSLNGGADGDILLGGSGQDTLIGGPDGDALVGGAGDDVLYGGAGDDDLFGSSGEDALYGGLGNDLISSLDPRGNITPEFNTTIVGNILGEVLTGRYGPELGERFLPRVQNGLLSADIGDTEADLVYGGAGNDGIFADLGDIVTGGEGVDFYVVLHAVGEEPVTVMDYEAGEPIRLVTNAAEGGAVEVVADGGGNLTISYGGSVFMILQNATVAAAEVQPLVQVRFEDVPFDRAP